MTHLCHTNEVIGLVVAIWNKFHAFMKSGRLNKVIKLSGINE